VTGWGMRLQGKGLYGRGGGGDGGQKHSYFRIINTQKDLPEARAIFLHGEERLQGVEETKGRGDVHPINVTTSGKKVRRGLPSEVRRRENQEKKILSTRQSWGGSRAQSSRKKQRGGTSPAEVHRSPTIGKGGASLGTDHEIRGGGGGGDSPKSTRPAVADQKGTPLLVRIKLAKDPVKTPRNKG